MTSILVGKMEHEGGAFYWGNKRIMDINPEGCEIRGTVTLRIGTVFYLFQYTCKDCRRLN